MKLRSMAATALTIGTTAMLAAQVPPTGERLTVTGCLQRAQRDGSVGGTIVGTSASPSTADDEANSSVMVNRFLLADAAETSSNANPTTPTGTAGRVERTTFGLSGHEADLEPHTGARVEVTGTVTPPERSGRGSGGAATASGAKQLQVDSWRVVAETCTVR
jgi:hypothetical protein